MRGHGRLAAALAAAVTLVSAPAAAGAQAFGQSSVPLEVSGGLTAVWHADPATCGACQANLGQMTVQWGAAQPPKTRSNWPSRPGEKVVQGGAQAAGSSAVGSTRLAVNDNP